jgi:Mg/Co/Ni transporter MgtE
LAISGLATLSLAISAASFSVAYIIGLKVFWLSMGFVTLVGAVLAMKFFHNRTLQKVGSLLVAIPIIATFVMTLLLHI